MKIERISFTKYDRPQTITLAQPERSAQQNSFTVINGVNGTGKSAILRIISDAALGLESSRQNKLFIRDINISTTGKVSRTIALSGTHNDRFPMNSGIELRTRSNKFDLLQFYYYGPKQSGNYTSAFKASNTISHSLLSNFPKLPFESLEYILEYLGFYPHISIVFQVGNRFKTRNSKEYLRHIGETINYLKEDLIGPSKLSESIFVSISKAESIVDAPPFRKLLRKPRHEKHIDFYPELGRAGMEIYSNEFFDFLGTDTEVSLPQLLADLIALGVLSTQVSLARKRIAEHLPLENLSSGEWQLLYSLLNLAINVDDDSLILVDEPENSLHPQWQSDYVSLIKRLVSHRKGCHIVIATHSPLIAASVMPEDGNLIRLDLDHDGIEIYAEMEDTAYGWLPEDVLKERFDMDSVRPPELTDATNEALRLLKFSSEPSPELADAAKKIVKLKQFLPSHDPLLSVLNAIVKIAFGDRAG